MVAFISLITSMHYLYPAKIPSYSFLFVFFEVRMLTIAHTPAIHYLASAIYIYASTALVLFATAVFTAK